MILSLSSEAYTSPAFEIWTALVAKPTRANRAVLYVPLALFTLSSTAS